MYTTREKWQPELDDLELQTPCYQTLKNMASHEQTRIKQWCWRSTTTGSNFIDRKKIHKYTHTNYIEQRLFEAGSVGTLQTVTFYFMWQKPGVWQAFGVLWYIICMNATLSPIYLFTEYLPYCLLYKYYQKQKTK